MATPKIITEINKSTVWPLRGYLWDTEFLIDGKDRLDFFDRPFTQPFQWIDRSSKTINDTNMTQSMTIPEPQKFSIFGVHLSTSPHLTDSDQENLFFDGRISFYIKERCYFTAMLPDMVVSKKEKRQWDQAVIEQNDEAKLEEKEPLNIGKFALMIRGYDLFRWQIVWSKPQKLWTPQAFRVAMYGIHYTSLDK